MTKKTIKHASGDVGLIFTAYNLRRIFNLVDREELKAYLRMLVLFVLVLKGCFKSFFGRLFYKGNKCRFAQADLSLC